MYHHPPKLKARRAFRGRLTAAALALLAVAPTAFGIEFQEEYAKQIKAADTVEPLTNDLFGDSVSLYNGAVTFNVTDTSLPGNNAIPVAASRRFVVESRGEGAKRFLFGDWDLDIPFISGVYQKGQSWQVQLPSGASYQRCSGPADFTQMAPPDIGAAGIGSPPWVAEEFWIPPSLYIPGRGSSPILYASGSLPQPANEAASKWTTKERDFFYCVSLAAGSGGQGEGFRVRTADGLTYTFNHLVGLEYGSLNHTTGQTSRVAAREEVRLYPTSVKDRFGNIVNYTWNGKQLQSIADAGTGGRLLTFSYNTTGQIATVSDQTRTWTYTYDNQGLASVTLPDTSRWEYDFAPIQAGNVLYNDPPPTEQQPLIACTRMLEFKNTNSRTATITHPSGAIGTFTFNARRHGRTNVPAECYAPTDDWRSKFNRTPVFFDTLSLTFKKIEGPGIIVPPQWTYTYPQPVGALEPAPGQPACSGTCLYKDVTVTQPDLTKVVHRFGVASNINDGQLLGTTVYNSQNVAVRSQTFTYATAGTAATPFPASMGTIPDQSRTDIFASAQIHPQMSRSTSQDGATFSWTAQQFDTYGRPTQTSKSGVNNARTLDERMTYHDNTTLWVLGQLQSVVYYPDATNQRETSAKTFSPNAQVASESTFGKINKIYTYNTDGTLQTVSDETGLAHATTLSNYYRGLPRLVTYADGTTESATVTNLGQIKTVTDEMGFTTTFNYWPNGKLQTLIPPNSDVTSWLPTNYVFEKVAADEHGLTAGHWRRTVTTGNRNTVVYYDALLRPVVTSTWDAAKPAEITYSVAQFDGLNRSVLTTTALTAIPFGDFQSVSTGTHTTYDAIDRPLTVTVDSEIGPLVTSYEYLTGFTRKVTNPRNYSSTSTFLAYDEPTYEFPKVITDEDGVTTNISRFMWGQPGTVTRSGTYNGSVVSTSRKFLYDSAMRLCKTYDPEGGGTITDYDLAGNVAWTGPTGNNTSFVYCQRENIAAGDKTTYTYDARNRLKNTIYPAGTNSILRDYYFDGALKTITSGDATWTYEYNKKRLLEKETLSIAAGTPDSRTYVIDWAYDGLGAPRQLVYPDNTVVDFAPDAFGRATQVGAYVSGVQYFPNGAIKNFTYGNNVQHELTQHPLRLTPKRSSDKLNGTAIVDFEYAYDANGNVGTITDYAANSLYSKSLTYDKFDRLVTASSPVWGGAASFVYDPVDNMRRMQVGVTAFDYVIDGTSNRLTSFTTNSANPQTLTYDADGNVRSKGSQVFTFDKANRLTNATGAPGQTGNETYQYDGNGRRVWIQKSGETAKRYAVYSQAGQLLQEVDKDGSPTNYIYLGGSLVAKGSLSVPPPAPPTKPGSISISPNPSTTGNYVVNWGASQNATKYVLQEQSPAGTISIVYNGPSQSASISGRTNGAWYYQVKACNAVDTCSAWTNPTTALVNTGTPLPAPEPVTITPDSAVPTAYNRFTINWTSVSGTAYYELQQLVGGNWTTPFTSPTALSYTKPGTWADGTYSFRVNACRSNGLCTSSYTVTKSVTQSVIFPEPPGTLSASPNPSATGNYTLTWATSANATFYKLGEVENGGVGVNLPPTSQTTWSPPTPKSNGTYQYTVMACNNTGPGGAERCSGLAGPVDVIVNNPNVPAPPAWITITDGDCTGAIKRTYTVLWDAPANVAHYELEESAPNNHVTVTTPVVPSASYVDRGFTDNVRPSYYYYRVRACNASNQCSAWTTSDTNFICVGGFSSLGKTLPTVTYYHTDALGSPVAETGASGNLIKFTQYEPYGKPTAGALENGPGYTGHVADSLSQLNYMQQRYYDPQVGRFLSVDPSRTNGNTGANFNRYWYGNNNPYKFTDPDGRDSAMFYTEARYQRPPPSAGETEMAGTVASFAPGAAAFECATHGCGVGGWAMAAADFAPVGKIFGALKKLASSLGKTSVRVEKFAKSGIISDYHLPGDVPNSYTVVRGGTADMPKSGEVFSVSYGADLGDAGAHVPYGQVRETTAGQIRNAGGDIDVTPQKMPSGTMNGQHSHVIEGDKSTFGPMQPNPVPKNDRIK